MYFTFSRAFERGFLLFHLYFGIKPKELNLKEIILSFSLPYLTVRFQLQDWLSQVQDPCLFSLF